MRVREPLEQVRVDRLPGRSFTGSGWKALRTSWRRQWEVLVV
jgi:hypothetical protein